MHFVPRAFAVEIAAVDRERLAFHAAQVACPAAYGLSRAVNAFCGRGSMLADGREVEQRHVRPSAGRTEGERDRAGVHQAIRAACDPVARYLAPMLALRQDRKGLVHTGFTVIVAGQLSQCRLAEPWTITLEPVQSQAALARE